MLYRKYAVVVSPENGRFGMGYHLLFLWVFFFKDINLIFVVSVNLSGVDRVDMSHFDLLKVLGTGGEFCWVYY